MPERMIAQVASSHDRQLALCLELERVADSLPANIDRQRCLYLARAVCRTVADGHSVEETNLFPAVEARLMQLGDASSTIERLRWEHMADLCVAEEIREALMQLGRGEGGPSPETLGYLLRGFFEGVRRHVAFERELLLLLAAPKLLN